MVAVLEALGSEGAMIDVDFKAALGDMMGREECPNEADPDVVC